MYYSLTLERDTGKIVLIDADNNPRDVVPNGVDVKLDRRNPFRQAPVEATSSVDVVKLPSKMLLNKQSLKGVLTGPPEKFRSEVKLLDSTKRLTVALWLEFRSGALKKHEFLVVPG